MNFYNYHNLYFGSPSRATITYRNITIMFYDVQTIGAAQTVKSSLETGSAVNVDAPQGSQNRSGLTLDFYCILLLRDPLGIFLLNAFSTYFRAYNLKRLPGAYRYSLRLQGLVTEFYSSGDLPISRVARLRLLWAFA